MVLTNNGTEENIAHCANNPCRQDGKAPWTEDNKYSFNNSHCYNINTQGPCTDPDQLYRVMPNDQTKVGCFSPAFSIVQIPTLCGRRRNGQCRPPVTFEENSNEPMMSNKLQAFLQRNRIAGGEDEVTTMRIPTTTTRIQSSTTQSGGDMWVWGD